MLQTRFAFLSPGKVQPPLSPSPAVIEAVLHVVVVVVAPLDQVDAPLASGSGTCGRAIWGSQNYSSYAHNRWILDLAQETLIPSAHETLIPPGSGRPTWTSLRRSC